MTKNFVQLDESKLPTTKGKNIDGFRFYSVGDKNYPSITTVLGNSKTWSYRMAKNVSGS